MDKKSILAIVLSLMVLYIYQIFFVKPVQRTQPPQPKSKASEAVEGKEKKPPAPPVVSEAKIILKTQQTDSIKVREIPIETPEYSAVFTTRGASLKSFKLKKYMQTIDKNSEPIELVDVGEDMPNPLTLSFAGSDFHIPENAIYETGTAAAAPGGVRQLNFYVEFPGAVRIEKIYRFHPGRYEVELEVRVLNLSPNALNQSTGLEWHQFFDRQRHTSQYDHVGPVSLTAKNVEREDINKMATTKSIGPDVSWGGFETKYFLAALIPQNPSLTGMEMSLDSRNMVTINMKTAKNILPPGQSASTNYSLYLGPKDYSILKASGVGLESAIDFGSWLKWLAMPLLFTLKFLHDHVLANYGVAIIILTTLIKIVFWPLGNKSYRSMKEMQKLQPKMMEIREKYKDDKARISQETMALYKAHKVNPMGGCLPMVIQIPVFFGLYKTLLYSIELRHSPFLWWIKDLSAPDALFGHIPAGLPLIGNFAVGLLPLIMGATMFIQQKMTPSAGDPAQAKIMLFMPVIFTLMFLNFPSGLVIYWLFNNIISIGQQYYINRFVS